MDTDPFEMDRALLEEWEECDRMQHANRKTLFIPEPLTAEERATLTKPQLLVRRGVHGLYIDACETEDTLERTYAATFPHGVEYDYGVLNPEIATLQRHCKVRQNDLRWTTSEPERDAIEREIIWVQAKIAETWQKHIESAPRGDKVRMTIRQKPEANSEDEEETLVGDMEEQETEADPQRMEHPWWLPFCDPEQEQLTDTQAKWLFKFLFVNFVSVAMLVLGIKRCLVSFVMCFLSFWLWNIVFGSQTYNWGEIDTELLRKINPKVCVEYVRWVCQKVF